MAMLNNQRVLSFTILLQLLWITRDAKNPPACVPEAASVASVSSPSMVAPKEKSPGSRVGCCCGDWGPKKPKKMPKKSLNRKNHGKNHGKFNHFHSFCGLISCGKPPIKLLSFLLEPLLGSDWNKGIHQANSVTKPNKPQSGIVYWVYLINRHLFGNVQWT